MDVFVFQHQDRFRAKNISVHATLDLAKEALEKHLSNLISEPDDAVSIKRKTPENTQPWHWPTVVYAVDLNQFTWEAGDVPDWLVIEKFPLEGIRAAS